MSVTVVLPYALQQLAGCEASVSLDLSAPVSALDVIRALEARYPALCGAIIDHNTGKRRPLVRFFVCGEDLSHEPLEIILPAVIAEGREEFLVVGAIAGG